MSYLAGDGAQPEGMKVSLASERIADHEFVAALRNACPELLAEFAKLKALLGEAVIPIEFALAHVQELREAWQRGVIDERDGRGGTRSNRNVDVTVELRTLLQRLKEGME